MADDILLLDCGSGGKASHRLIGDLFMRHFANPALNKMDDAAFLDITGPLAMSTDTFTVDPIFFPGGNIGSLAVHGTVNDVAMLGARPRYLSCGFLLEEGLPMADLEKIVIAMAEAAREAGVDIVTGDTKVVPRGAVDKVFINTTGVGEVVCSPYPSGNRAAPGDAVLISGTMGDHGLAILSSRQGLNFDAPVQSDSASLNHLIASLFDALGTDGDIHVLRDPTRGGLATTLNEITEQSGVTCVVEQDAVPVSPAVAAGCSFLGLDPLYLANEGKLICIVPEAKAEAALSVLRADPKGADAARIGTMHGDDAPAGKPGQVVLRTPLGGHRLLNMLEGEQLPRIC